MCSKRVHRAKISTSLSSVHLPLSIEQISVPFMFNLSPIVLLILLPLLFISAVFCLSLSYLALSLLFLSKSIYFSSTSFSFHYSYMSLEFLDHFTSIPLYCWLVQICNKTYFESSLVPNDEQPSCKLNVVLPQNLTMMRS
jgi:hypothetical protein